MNKHTINTVFLYLAISIMIPVICEVRSSYTSHYGQDRILNKYFFHDKRNGTFVDVAAYDGIFCNNTYFFEKNLDWTGICIDCNAFEQLTKNRNSICID